MIAVQGVVAMEFCQCYCNQHTQHHSRHSPLTDSASFIQSLLLPFASHNSHGSSNLHRSEIVIVVVVAVVMLLVVVVMIVVVMIVMVVTLWWCWYSSDVLLVLSAVAAVAAVRLPPTSDYEDYCNCNRRCPKNLPTSQPP